MGGDSSDFDDFLSESDFKHAANETNNLTDNLLDQNVIDFVEMGNSPEYQKALDLLRRYNMKRNYIKQILQTRNVTKHKVRRGDTFYSLEFSVSDQLRVAVAELPADVRLKYTKPSQVWRIKHIAQIEL